MSAYKPKIIIDFLQSPKHEDKLEGQKGGIAIVNAISDERKAQNREEEESLNRLVDKSVKVLARIRNIIPIFTDEIVIDMHKITIINRPFFFSEHIQALSIKNINDVYIQTIPFLATISIMDIGLPKSHIIHIKWFWKKDAEKARRLITGLMEAAKENVDLKNIDSNDNLRAKIEALGKIRGTHTTVSGA